MVGSADFAWRSKSIWRSMATLARLSNLSAEAVSPLVRKSSAFWEAASAFWPQLRDASWSSR
ncbi:Uncharacterised protein [Streptococcus pneumoniae]|nr:Uncharacterised protein [Streptococcus pneumoniae]